MYTDIKHKNFSLNNIMIEENNNIEIEISKKMNDTKQSEKKCKKVSKKKCNKCNISIKKMFREIYKCKKCQVLYCQSCISYLEHNCPKSEEFKEEYKNQLKNQLIDAKFNKIIKI